MEFNTFSCEKFQDYPNITNDEAEEERHYWIFLLLELSIKASHYFSIQC